MKIVPNNSKTVATKKQTLQNDSSREVSICIVVKTLTNRTHTNTEVNQKLRVNSSTGVVVWGSEVNLILIT